MRVPWRMEHPQGWKGDFSKFSAFLPKVICFILKSPSPRIAFTAEYLRLTFVSSIQWGLSVALELTRVYDVVIIKFAGSPMKFTIIFVVVLCLSIIYSERVSPSSVNMATASSALLSDPFLQSPTSDSVRVVWFTEFPSDRSYVKYGRQLEKETDATTTKLSRVREDQNSLVGQEYTQPTVRDIWRHEAIVTGLTPNQRVPYQVVSVQGQEVISSKQFTLASNPTPDKPLKILLTSDHQLKPMTSANLQKVVETVGRVDAVFFAGDLVNIPDRASEWFDDSRGGAFFPGLQGRANYQLGDTVYHGGEIIQYAPLFTALGNHEVMGRFDPTQSLKEQFYDAIPRSVAQQLYPQEDLKTILLTLIPTKRYLLYQKVSQEEKNIMLLLLAIFA